MTDAVAPDAIMEAVAYMNTARKYQKAGSRLLNDILRQPDVEADQTALDNPAYSDPLYFLFAHTVELACKAFLRFHGEAVPTRGKSGHDIVKLHGRCQGVGLLFPGDPRDLLDVVKLLAHEHNVQGFRYYSPDSAAVPDLLWTRDIVNLLIQVVRARIGENHLFPPGTGVKMRFVIPKHVVDSHRREGS